MTPKLLQRPILVGGLGLTAGAWLLQSMDSTIADLGGVAVWGAIAVGSGLWWLKQQNNKTVTPLVPLRSIDAATLDKAFSTVESRIEELSKELGEAGDQSIVESLQQQLTTLKSQFNRQELQLAILGSPSVGKTSLMQLMQLTPAETTLRSEADLSQDSSTIDITQFTNADLVLFVTTGDLTDSEFQTLQSLTQNQHRVLLIFNKQDQYLPADRPVILQQLRERVQSFISAEDVVATTAQPAPVKVRQHLADGTIQERAEQPTPEISALQSQLQHVLTTQSQSLVLATVYRQTQSLLRSVQTELNQVRRVRALPVIEQYQWIAAATAFANPVPSLDLLATATINAQMVMDLGALYQQPFSLEQAKTVTGNLGSQMVKLGLVEMASQAIAPLLKSHMLTYVAGGTLQGISAAYLTRLAGLSLVEYFEEQAQLGEPNGSFQIDRLIQKLKAVFNDNQRAAFLQNLVKQGVSRLAPQATASA